MSRPCIRIASLRAVSVPVWILVFFTGGGALDTAAGAPRRKTVGAVVVVSAGKEWKMAARVAEQVRQVPKMPPTRFVLVERGVPTEPVGELRQLLRRIRRARRLTHKLRLRRAIQLLEAVIRDARELIRTRGATPGLMRRLRQAHGYLGSAQQLNADAAAARAAFAVMLNIDPSYTLSPKYFPTEVIKAFDQLRAGIRRNATLRVNTDRPAFVFVDGHLKGTAPTVVQGLTPGLHVVELRRLGAVRITRVLEVDARLGATLKARIVDDPEQKNLRQLLSRVERELRNRRKAGPAVAALAKRLRVDQVLACRASLDEGEASLYDAQARKFRKRVRRLSAIPGTPPVKSIAEALERPTPTLDLQTGSGAQGGACESNADCPDGSCVAGRCVSETPVYKKWWFWTIIGLGVAAVAGGTAALLTAPQRPTIRITLGAP